MATAIHVVLAGLLLVAVVSLGVEVQRPTCSYLNWYPEGQYTCQDFGKVESVRNARGGLELRSCCSFGDYKGLQQDRQSVIYSCFNSTCVEKGTRGSCVQLETVFIDGSELEYEPGGLPQTCTMDNGRQGEFSRCCAKSCTETTWTREGQYTCKDFAGVPWESVRMTRGDGMEMRICCSAGDYAGVQQSRQKFNKDTCYNSRCMEKGAPLCAKSVFIDGAKVEYEEALRSACNLNDGREGEFAQCCAKNSTEGLLAVTMAAEKHEFPHQVALDMGCGGTVYNEWHILTASHCVIDQKTGEPKDAKDITVTFATNIGGHYHGTVNAKKENQYEVEKVIYHEDYSKLKGKTNANYFNDIALLRLKKRVPFGPNVKALRIAPQGFQPLEYADQTVIVGWGRTDMNVQSKHLQKASIALRSDEKCFRNGGPWPWGIQYQDQYLCVGGIMDMTYSPSSADGDSGGPAICRGPDGNAVLCGITSFGADSEACVRNTDYVSCLPSVYAEVAHFRNWTETNGGSQDQLPEEYFFKAPLYGGKIDDKSKYQHQVRIKSASGKPCGGTLISSDTVLTAAQCVVHGDGSRRTLPGLQVTSRMGQSAGVLKATPMYGFRRDGDPVDPSKQGKPGKYWRVTMADNYHTNDLAVVKLDRNVISGNEVAELPDKSPTGTAMEVAYPRDTKFGGEMRERSFKILTRDECQNRLKWLSRLGLEAKDLQIEDNVFCGVETYSGGSTCDRELGGGLICKGPGGKDVLCGVQIFRLCESTIPNVFTDVSKAKGWIQNNM